MLTLWPIEARWHWNGTFNYTTVPCITMQTVTTSDPHAFAFTTGILSLSVLLFPKAKKSASLCSQDDYRMKYLIHGRRSNLKVSQQDFFKGILISMPLWACFNSIYKYHITTLEDYSAELGHSHSLTSVPAQRICAVLNIKQTNH